MLRNYDQALKEISSELRKVYSDILSGVSSENYYNEMLKFNRLEKLQIEAQKIYNQYARQANKDTIRISKTSMADMYYRKEFIYSSFSVAAYQPLILDPRLIELTVLGTAKAWKDISTRLIDRYGDISAFQAQYGTITDIFLKNRVDDLKKIQDVIFQGIFQGQGARTVIKNLMEVFDTTKFNATRIQQTEFTRITNAAAYAANVDAYNQGLDIKKMWVISPTLNPHKPPHSQLNGVMKRHDKYFKLGAYQALYPGNFNGGAHNYLCHCFIVDVIEGVKPTTRMVKDPRTGEKKIFSFDDFEKWVKEEGF